MEKPLPARNEISTSLSKAEQIKFQSFEDKLLHYDPQTPFLAILGADTDRLIDVFTKHIEAVFKGGVKVIPYKEPFDLSAIADTNYNQLLVIQLPQAAIADKGKIAENFLFYRDIVKERNMKLAVICNTEIFNELQLKATDFISMGLEANQFVDMMEAKENDLMEGDGVSAAEKELQEKIADLERYKKFGIVREEALFEKLQTVAVESLNISKYNIALQISFEMLNYAKKYKNRFSEMVALGHIAGAYRHLGETSQAIVYLKEAVKKSDFFKHSPAKPGLLTNLASIYSSTSQYDLAEKKFAEALRLAKKEADNKLEADILCNIGTLYYRQGRNDDALGMYHKTLFFYKNAKMIHNGRSIATAYGNIGMIYNDKGELNKALSYLHQSLDRNKKTNNKMGVITSLLNISSILTSTSNYSQAIEYNNKAKFLAEDINSMEGLMNSHLNIANIYLKLSKLDEAEKSLLKSQAMELHVISPLFRAELLFSMGELAFERKHNIDSLNYFRESYKLGMEINDRKGTIQSLFSIGKVQLNSKDYHEARSSLVNALKMSKQDSLPHLQALAMNYLAQLLLEENQKSESLNLSFEALSIVRKLQNFEYQIKNLLRIFILYSDTKESETATRYLNEAKEIASTMDNKEKLFRDIAEAEKRVSIAA